MTQYFALVDQCTKEILRVIIADQSFIDSGNVGDPSHWIETDYESFENQHNKGGTPIRKNYAGIGMIYDDKTDSFIYKKPSETALFDEEKGTWYEP